MLDLNDSAFELPILNRAIKGLRWRPQFQLILHPHKFQKERENRQPDSRCL